MKMAKIAPSSTVTLYKNIDITNEQQIAFDSKAHQQAYFAAHVLRSTVNCTYIRHNGSVKIEDTTGLMQTCNYISFTNPSFENVIFYARVVDFAYVNNVTVEIVYQIDWFQTFMFDVRYEDCLIEREHLSVSDFALAATNPYNPNIYEFQTNEELQVTKDMEPNYHIAPSGSKVPGVSDIWYNAPEEDDKRPVTMILLSQFDDSELDNFTNNFEKLFDFKINYDGTVIQYTDGLYMPAKANFPITHPFRIYGFLAPHGETGEGNVAKMTDAVNYLSLNGITSEIIGIYKVDYFFIRVLCFSGSLETATPFTTAPRTAGTDVVNKKLRLYPFEYLRAETSGGDVKEYRYEFFKDIIQTGGECKFKFLATIEGVPTIYLMPIEYRNYAKNSLATDISFMANKNERLVYAAYPQVAYSTDAYLSFLNQQYSYNLGSRTTGSQETGFLKTLGNFGSKILSGAGNALSGNFGAAGNDVIDAFGSIADISNYYHGNKETDLMRSFSGSDASEIASGDAVSSVYNVAKPAYIADEYHPAPSNDVLGYMINGKSPSIYKFTYVHLKPAIVDSYDKYFTMYGYNSRRVGLPRICNYITGSTDEKMLPKFLPQQNGRTATYVKTQNMHVESTMLPVSNFIESMFNNGMRFVDGNTLIAGGE